MCSSSADSRCAFTLRRLPTSSDRNVRTGQVDVNVLVGQDVAVGTRHISSRLFKPSNP